MSPFLQQQQLYCHFISAKTYSPCMWHARIASKGTDWGEMKCVFKCKGPVRWKRRGGLKGFREMGFQAFLAVKDRFGVNCLKRRTFYFKKFIIQKCIKGWKRKLGLHIPNDTRDYISAQKLFLIADLFALQAQKERPGASCFTLCIYLTE